MQKQTLKRPESGSKFIYEQFHLQWGLKVLYFLSLYALPFLRLWLARIACAYTSARSIGFCVIWVCISSSSILYSLGEILSDCLCLWFRVFLVQRCPGGSLARPKDETAACSIQRRHRNSTVSTINRNVNLPAALLGSHVDYCWRRAATSVWPLLWAASKAVLPSFERSSNINYER